MKADVVGRFILVNIVETPYEIDNNKGIAVKLGLKQDKELFDVKCTKQLAEEIVKNRVTYDTFMYSPVDVALNITAYAEKLADRAKATSLKQVKLNK